MSDKIKDGGPAFPIEKFPVKFDKKGYAESFKSYSGMTLRDYFAAQVMQGVLANSTFNLLDDDLEQMSNKFYKLADAMLEAREK